MLRDYQQNLPSDKGIKPPSNAPPVKIDGENCLSKKWIVRTWKPDSSSGWVIAKEESAFIDGMGWVRIIIGDDLRPQMKDRLR
uniref:Uncharacterized protein n=1 Tax=Meloidogyne javanica TaxID=6303 RepID=A0A915LT46_MELJA